MVLLEIGCCHRAPTAISNRRKTGFLFKTAFPSNRFDPEPLSPKGMPFRQAGALGVSGAGACSLAAGAGEAVPASTGARSRTQGRPRGQSLGGGSCHCTPRYRSKALIPPLSFFWMISEGHPLLGSSCIVQKTCADLRKICRPVRGTSLGAHGNAMGQRAPKRKPP